MTPDHVYRHYHSDDRAMTGWIDDIHWTKLARVYFRYHKVGQKRGLSRAI